MSNKRKTTSRNPVHDFMDNLLFMQSFDFETSVDVDTVIERLQESSRERKGWRHPYPRFELTTENAYDHHLFDLKAKDNNQQYTIVHATGAIEPTAQDGTVVSGEVRFGVVYFFLLGVSVVWMLFIFQFFGLALPPLLLGLVMLAPLSTFVHMFWKRRGLLKDIEESIKPRMSDRKFDKLKRQDTDADDVEPYLSEYESESLRYDQQ